MVVTEAGMVTDLIPVPWRKQPGIAVISCGKVTSVRVLLLAKIPQPLEGQSW